MRREERNVNIGCINEKVMIIGYRGLMLLGIFGR